MQRGVLIRSRPRPVVLSTDRYTRSCRTTREISVSLSTCGIWLTLAVAAGEAELHFVLPSVWRHIREKPL